MVSVDDVVLDVRSCSHHGIVYWLAEDCDGVTGVVEPDNYEFWFHDNLVGGVYTRKDYVGYLGRKEDIE